MFSGSVHFKRTTKTEVTIGGDRIAVSVMPHNLINSLDVPDLSWEPLLRQKGIAASLSVTGRDKIAMILGIGHYNTLVKKELTRSVRLKGSFIAEDTKFGWVISGGLNESNSVSCVASAEEHHCDCKDLDTIFREPLLDTSENDAAVDKWEVDYEEKIWKDPISGRWVVKLPFITSQRPTNNFGTIRTITKRQYERLSKKGDLVAYEEALMQYVRDGQAHQVHDLPEDAFYINHLGVRKAPNAPLRIVLDASFTSKNGIPLNKVLYKGKTKGGDLRRILLKWRLSSLAVLGDLSKAFLQIKIDDSDRKYLRYLWPIPGSERVAVFEFERLPFGLTCSPFLLFAALKKTFSQGPPEIRSLLDDSYVDDIAFLGENKDDVGKKIQLAKEALEKASFTLHKWVLPKALHEATGWEGTHEGIKSCLGVPWDLSDDLVFVEKPDELPPEQITRRMTSRLIHSVYDPLGLLGPFYMRLKLLMKDVINETSGWDSRLPKDLEDRARTTLLECQDVEKIKRPRLAAAGSEYSIRGFCDASKEGIGACIYTYKHGEDRGELLWSKSRICPRKSKRTIPQLELAAATLLSEMCAQLRGYVHPNIQFHLYSDSTITLGRINSAPNRFTQFVAHRVALIQHYTEGMEWHHIPTDINCADALSRGQTMLDLTKNQLWTNGPSLKEIENRLSPQTTFLTISGEDEALTREEFHNKAADLGYQGLSDYVDQRIKDDSTHEKPETKVWREYQKLDMKVELEALRASKEIPKTSIHHKKLLILDKDGLVKEDRRLSNANVPYETQFPLLANDGKFIRSYIRNTHSKLLAHASAENTANHIKQYISLVNLDRIVKSEISHCMKCNHLRGKPFETNPGDLPPDRVDTTNQEAFTHIGVDLFGPLLKKKRSTFYGMIFVCSVTRAVHIEVLTGKRTDIILDAFTRFIARRGYPRTVRSDNEKGFIKASPYVKDWCNSFFTALSRGQKDFGFEWLLNPPLAKWWGGTYERLIGVVKNALANWNLKKLPNERQLTVILCEVEALVNSRPLLKHSKEQIAITPSHLITGKPLVYRPPVLGPSSQKDDIEEVYNETKLFRSRLWENLQKRYITSLRRFFRRKASTRNPVVGELVLLKDEDLKRCSWPIGVIQEVFSGSKGPRTARVLTQSGHLVIRDISHLVPLEASAHAPPGSVAEREGERETRETDASATETTT